MTKKHIFIKKLTGTHLAPVGKAFKNAASPASPFNNNNQLERTKLLYYINLKNKLLC